MPKLPTGSALHFSEIFGKKNLSFLRGFDIPTEIVHMHHRNESTCYKAYLKNSFPFSSDVLLSDDSGGCKGSPSSSKATAFMLATSRSLQQGQREEHQTIAGCIAIWTFGTWLMYLVQLSLSLRKSHHNSQKQLWLVT